ncbi:MAG: 5-formyltetrahydrofolate cyclo-ligase [Emcibacteraceae bacterium]|nr:5-formyltetrahydrofolate cyclo-ligase [Emcibacteraceae bacterium]MDG1996147.1 5-formyltetrahydrofolate cyclo-ligase [Emcibacteraceae bacterium]
MMSNKNTIRNSAKEVRDLIHASDDGMAARNIAAKIVMLEELDEVKTVAGYYPIKDELDLLVTLKVLHAARFPLALPSIIEKNRPLEFRAWDMRTQLVDGPFGTKESIEDQVVPEVILVPLLAFDAKGGRIGYGGGFYDRTLAALKEETTNTLAIGIAYEGQKLAEVPMEDYDQRLDMVVTEQNIYRFE